MLNAKFIAKYKLYGSIKKIDDRTNEDNVRISTLKQQKSLS